MSTEQDHDLNKVMAGPGSGMSSVISTIVHEQMATGGTVIVIDKGQSSAGMIASIENAEREGLENNGKNQEAHR